MKHDLNWQVIDTVLLDMDGTLLDLHFDNHFWLEFLPRRYAERQGLPESEARQQLMARYAAVRGTLDWYCLDYWTASLGLDLLALKEEVAHRIALHPQAIPFLEAVRASGRKAILVTNAHPASLALKLARTPLGRHLDAVWSSHSLGLPKEAEGFWAHLRGCQPFDPSRTLLVDDNLHVLLSAQNAGIRFLRGVRRPDSQGQPIESEDFVLIDGFAELLPPSSPS